jgi:hypothetical protein
MIDGFKFRITDPAAVAYILGLPCLTFVAAYELRAGIIRGYHLSAKYKSLRIDYYDDTIYISGNLYEYWSGLKNYQNFRLKDAVEALRLLEAELRISLAKIDVMKLEYGLNIFLPQIISATSFIENVFVYKGKLGSHIYYRNGGLMRHFKLSEIEIKIYDKGRQHGNGNHYLRYEIVIKKRQNLARKGIKSAFDLLDKSKIAKINEEFINTINHLIIYDTQIVNCKQLTIKQKDFFLNHNNASSWKKLMEERPALYRKRKPLFRKSIKNITGNDWTAFLLEAVRNESQSLLLEK